MSETVEFDDFESYNNQTRHLLYWLFRVSSDGVVLVGTLNFGISLTGVLLNMFHLMILTRKSMRNNSINTLMIGIAFCDLFIMLFGAYSQLLEMVYTDW